MQVASRTIVCAVGMTLLFFSCTCRGVPNEFFLLPSEQRDAEFQKYDLETQYKINICGQKREPPMSGLASPLARQGGRIVLFLKAKLENADDDSTVEDIVYVFAEMNVRGTYDLAADKSLMEELRLKVSRVKDPAWQNMIEKNLPEIQQKSPKTSMP
jgi:hypothetical protein